MALSVLSFSVNRVQDSVHGLTTTLQPSWADQPWPYKFSKGDSAWARGGNARWRRVIIEDNGTLEMHDGRIVTVYTARWRRQGNIVRGCFSPLDGDLKPDNEQTLLLLAEDEALIMS